MKKVTSTLLLLLACIYLYAQPGTPDVTFNALGTPGYKITDIDGQRDIVKGLVIKPSDKSIYVTGFIQNGGADTLFIAHFMSDGTLDPGFGTDGIVKYLYLNNTTHGNAIGLQSDGTVVVAGWSYPNSNHDFFVGRFNGTTGAVVSQTTDDLSTITGLSGHDEINALAIQSDDKIVVTGFASMNASVSEDFAIARYTAAGLLDNTTFNATGYRIQNINGDDEPRAITIDKTTGDIIVAGTSEYGGANPNFAIMRVSSTGALVFGAPGYKTQDINSGSEDDATAVVIDRNGNIVVAGTTASLNPPNIALARFTPTGALDNAVFGGGTGIVITNYSGASSNDHVSSVDIQVDDKIIVGGVTDGGNTGNYDPMLLRYSDAGVLDITFGTNTPIPNGKATMDIAGSGEDAGAIVLSDQKIFFAGFTQATPDIVLAVFNNDASSLPLVLSSFYAQKQTNKVVLQWQTSSEENVKQFVIERSTDGKTYKAIGQVAAVGNSNLIRNYTFADQSPYMSQNNYYRLNMQDADGTTKYSKILIVKFDGQLVASLGIFPNPTRDLLQVQLPDGMEGTVGLQIIDMNGRVVKWNNLASDGHALNTTLDVSTLVKGIYILRATAGNTTVTKRFSKQ
ncbi:MULTISPECIES: T9SS type A sorting domain-containing protein [Niastella]|uniref:T9SS type A sorting domain-containing protein n=1 Tax=Niastella soli TaxID=2821487 RepID=A0ABS3YUB9_9BACT|nr:T9SS type A sorting domain-containing protein [Niastella soli]MBO9201117.1 T9SS type A sorting domain-containing protein [Niastella soli]